MRLADAELSKFLDSAAREANSSVDALLRKVLHIEVLTGEPEFRRLFEKTAPEILILLKALDYHLRILNPGLHYVYRGSYLGYRREANRPVIKDSERSQVFLSVLPRSEILRVVLPVDPQPYLKLPNCRAVTGKGHHGVGNLQVDVTNSRQLAIFLKVFDEWLRGVYQ